LLVQQLAPAREPVVSLDPRLRLLEPVAESSYCDAESENLLIQDDHLAKS
jgi:hypothetical protein